MGCDRQVGRAGINYLYYPTVVLFKNLPRNTQPPLITFGLVEPKFYNIVSYPLNRSLEDRRMIVDFND